MTVGNAKHLWFEAGDMSGGSRNQVEFSEELVKFFDEDSRAAGQVFVAYDSKTKAYCPLANRGKDYGQWSSIWRLGLITEDKGGQPYPEKIIHLEKKLIGKRFVYLIEVIEPNSAEHDSLLANSSEQGITGGAEGRAFGYW